MQTSGTDQNATEWSQATKRTVAIAGILIGIFVLYISRPVIPLIILAAIVSPLIYNSKETLSEGFALLGAGNMVFLAVAISLTILLGVSSGGVIALSKKTSNYKEVIGWVLGAAIAVAWINFALIYGDTVSLAVAIILTILLGTLSGGFIALSNKPKTI